MNQDEKKYRLELIRDSLIGISYHLPSPEVILFPFLDNISLLHQAPLVFTFWEGPRCVYSSLQDPDFLRRHPIAWNLPSKQSLIPLRKTPYVMTIHYFGKLGKENSFGLMELPIDQKATELTQELLCEKGRFSLPDDLFTALGSSIGSQTRTDHSATLANNKEIIPKLITIDYSEVKVLLEPMRVVLDEVFSDPVQAEQLWVNKENFSMLRYPNIFNVIRTFTTSNLRWHNTFPYTAGILLLSKMKERLAEWCATKCLIEKQCHQVMSNSQVVECLQGFTDAEQCVTALEQPLSLSSRSVSDLVFSSGIVEFGRKALEKSWDVSVAGDDQDTRRRAIEKCIYPSEARLFYIPVHVGGTPWITLFTFTFGDPVSHPKSWHHNYCFYRDLAQKAAALIRQKSHAVYEKLLIDTLINHLRPRNKGLDFAALNESAQKCAQVYPFSLMTVHESEGGDNDVYVPGRGTITLKFSQNPFFPRQVAWNTGEEKEKMFLESCRTAIGDFTQLEKSIEVNAVAQSSHLLKVPLRTLSSIADSSGTDRDNKLQRQILKIINLHDAASVLLGDKKGDIFRNKYRKQIRLMDFIAIIKEQFNDSLMYLSDASASGNCGPNLTKLRQKKVISFDDEDLQSDGDMVYYFEPLMFALFDGLMVNAITSVNESAPGINVRLAITPIPGGGMVKSHLYLIIENSVGMSPERLEPMLRRLNSPGPDMVGVTEMHWISNACWPTTNKPLSWSPLSNPQRVCAKALIAEVLR